MGYNWWFILIGKLCPPTPATKNSVVMLVVHVSANCGYTLFCSEVTFMSEAREDGCGMTSRSIHAWCKKGFNEPFPGCTLCITLFSESITHPESNNMCLMNKTAQNIIINPRWSQQLEKCWSHSNQHDIRRCRNHYYERFNNQVGLKIN